MAHAAVERVGPPGLVRLVFDPTPGRLELALRLALICAASTLVGEIYRKPPISRSAVYLAFFVNKPDRTSSVVLGFVATILISLCLLLILGAEHLIIDHPPWKVAFIGAVSVTFLFIGSASVLRELGGIIALIVGYGWTVATQLPLNALARACLSMGGCSSLSRQSSRSSSIS